MSFFTQVENYIHLLFSAGFGLSIPKQHHEFAVIYLKSSTLAQNS